MKDLRQFSISDIEDVTTEESDEFAIARVAVLSTKPNHHGVNITEEILRRDGYSVLGKWLIAEYDSRFNDVTTHTDNTHIIGVVPQDSKVDFVTNDDGSVTMYVDAIISKVYATQVYKLFKMNNFRNVSVEMRTYNDRLKADGTIDIDGLKIYGICVLGLRVNGSCPDANMEIVQFSADNAEEYYNKKEALRLANELNRFAENIKTALTNKVELSDKEEGMEETKELSESTVIEEVKELSDDVKEKETDVVMEEIEEKVEETETIMEETQSEDTVSEEKEQEAVEEMSCDTEMGCGDKEMEATEETEVMAEENVVETFSICSYVSNDMAIPNGLEECYDEIKTMSADEIVAKLFELTQSNAELLNFKTERLTQDRDARVKSIMARVKADLEPTLFAELQKEGATLSFDELGSFENKVKAFAYESTQSKPKENTEEVFVFGGTTDTIKNQADITADDIYKKYL